ncbi:unnamed protein product [Oppiella nova]|uniref:Uncharacterized protein n=1 Tax=Oppiella nova TaxID=334625 RepID=A0A7R9LS26_9ACAR|nr:unnamed protein product [Oppiella nova]CAG2166409.1 unnamed protein product [Oppiella nova]
MLVKVKHFGLSVYVLVFNIINTIIWRLISLLNYKIMDNRDNDENTDIDLLIKQRQHHKKSFDIISRALKIDEKIDDQNIEQKRIVIEMYSKGIEELEEGIGIDLSGVTGEEGERARKLQLKMNNNLLMVRERRERLGMQSLSHFLRFINSCPKRWETTFKSKNFHKINETSKWINQ